MVTPWHETKSYIPAAFSIAFHLDFLFPATNYPTHPRRRRRSRRRRRNKMVQFECSKCKQSLHTGNFHRKYRDLSYGGDGVTPRVCFKCEGKPVKQCSSCKNFLPIFSGLFTTEERNKSEACCQSCKDKGRDMNRREESDEEELGGTGMYLGHGEWDTTTGAEEAPYY